ncbi:MAG: hypothetical protein LBB66_02695 [Desulfovibrio sp.]|nr:hypothetical protein [Desulfovibrio sp.]
MDPDSLEELFPPPPEAELLSAAACCCAFSFSGAALLKASSISFASAEMETVSYPFDERLPPYSSPETFLDFSSKSVSNSAAWSADPKMPLMSILVPHSKIVSEQPLGIIFPVRGNAFFVPKARVPQGCGAKHESYNPTPPRLHFGIK